jgi:hypothetical protein
MYASHEPLGIIESSCYCLVYLLVSLVRSPTTVARSSPCRSAGRGHGKATGTPRERHKYDADATRFGYYSHGKATGKVQEVCRKGTIRSSRRIRPYDIATGIPVLV